MACWRTPPEPGVRLFRAVGEEHWAGWTTRTLAWTYAEAGDKDRARAIHEDNLRRARALDSPSLEAALPSSLAWLLVGDGRFQDPFPLLKHSLLIRREMELGCADQSRTGGRRG